MRKLLLAAFLVLCSPAFAQQNYGPPPSVVGVATAGQIPGITSNTAASAGNVGEIIKATVVSGSAVGLTNATDTNITSIALTAGDWDVDCTIYFSPAGTTVVTSGSASISQTTATRDLTPGAFGNIVYPATTVPNGTFSNTVPNLPVTLSGSATIFLVARSTFTTSTMTAYGVITARRVR